VFGCEIMVWEPVTTEDNDLIELIADGRLAVENDTGRKIMLQTIDYYPQSWPSSDRMKLPYGSLVSVTHVKYTDSAGLETTLTPTTDYVVETNGDQCGYLVLPYQGSWPSATLNTSNPIVVRFICGAATQAAVRVCIKQAVKRWCVNNYMNRGDDVIGVNTVNYDKTYERHCNIVGRLFDMDFL